MDGQGKWTSGYERRNPNHPLRRPGDYGPDGQRTRHWLRPERQYRLSYRRRPATTIVSTIVAVLASATIAVATARVGSIYTSERLTGSGWADCTTPISWTTDASKVRPALAVQVRSELAAAFNIWGSAAGLTFVDGGETPVVFDDATSTLTTVADINRNIAVYFVPKKESGRITDFVVGFASPDKVFVDTREIVGGYVVYSSDYIAQVDSSHRKALFLHEIGHALGLTDSDDKGNVMYRYIDRNVSLADGDIDGLKELIKICAE